MKNDKKKLKIQFNYQNQNTKYYHLTEGSGYPSADYHFVYTSQKETGLVIPETRVDSANQVPGNEQYLSRTTRIDR